MAPRTALFWRIGVVNEFNGIHICSPYLCHTAPGKGHEVRIVGLVGLLVMLITAHHRIWWFRGRNVVPLWVT
jgi:hypothetical protein